MAAPRRRLGRRDGAPPWRPGEEAVAGCGDLAAGRRFALQFWDANATKALHIGHLRNLAIGNALAAALGAGRRRRSSGAASSPTSAAAWARRWPASCAAASTPQGWSENDEKSDHFVGFCYADYV